MGKGQLRALDKRIDAAETLLSSRAAANDTTLREATEQQLSLQLGQRRAITTRLAEKDSLGEFPATLDAENPAVIARRKRSAVLLGSQPLLPLVAQDKVAYPNIIARSPLFGIAPKLLVNERNRPVFRQLLAKEGETEVLVSGCLLSQTDLDVWLECLKLAEADMSQEVVLSVFAFVKRLGKTPGTKTYMPLRESLTRLALILLTVRRGAEESVPEDRILTYRLFKDGDTLMLGFKVSPNWARLLGVGSWSAQLRSLRHQLAGKPLAQILVTIGHTHKSGFPFTLEALYKASRSEAPMAEFKRLATKALDAAVQAGAFKPASHLNTKTNTFHLVR